MRHLRKRGCKVNALPGAPFQRRIAPYHEYFFFCSLFFFFYCITNIINISQVAREKIMSCANDSRIFSPPFTLVHQLAKHPRPLGGGGGREGIWEMTPERLTSRTLRKQSHDPSCVSSSKLHSMKNYRAATQITGS